LNLIPTDDRILVKMMKPKSEGKIIVPEHLVEKGNIAEVIAIGRLCDEVEVGQRVMIDVYAGMGVNIDGVSYLMIRPIDVVALVE
jgi:co-chaperonin GroES (HSP10)